MTREGQRVRIEISVQEVVSERGKRGGQSREEEEDGGHMRTPPPPSSQSRFTPSVFFFVTSLFIAYGWTGLGNGL